MEIFQQNTIFDKKFQNFTNKFEITNAKMSNFCVADFLKSEIFLLNNNNSRIVGKIVSRKIGKIVSRKIGKIWMKIGHFNFCLTLLKLLRLL